jgi:RNA polymerase sigma-70 factor (ECF subfamily)
MIETNPQAIAPPADDETLVRLILVGDRSAFELLMRRHNRRLYRLARAVLRNSAEAEDALQDAYLLAFRSLHQFRGDASVSTWLSRLVLNESLGRRRRDQRRQTVVPITHSPTEIDVVPDAADDLPDQLTGREQVRALLESKLDALPQDFRIVFALRSIEELSVEETAQTLGIPEATVRSRHFRAKSLLRESLAREFDVAERDVFEFGGAHCDRVVAEVLSKINAE